jgi:hypothetical protein
LDNGGLSANLSCFRHARRCRSPDSARHRHHDLRSRPSSAAFCSHFFVFFCFNNAAQGGSDHVPAAAKCIIDKPDVNHHAAAIESATKQRINKATIDAVASKLHRNDRVLQPLPAVTAVTAKGRSFPTSAEARSVLMLLNFLTAASVTRHARTGGRSWVRASIRVC